MTSEQAVRWLLEQPGQEEFARLCYFDSPVSEAALRFANGEEWREVERLLRPVLPGRVLELGAGRGITSYAFARGGSRVVAVEPDPSPLVGAGAIREVCRTLNVNIEVIESIGESLSLPDDSFDVVYCRAVLHHARDLHGIMAQAARVLRPGGMFLGSREHVITRKEDLPAFLKTHALHHLTQEEHAYTLAEYRAAIEASGLKLQKLIGPFDSPINYYPMRTEQLRAEAVQAARQVFGRRLGWRIGALAVWQVVYGRFRSWRCSDPGRLYSFVARK